MDTPPIVSPDEWAAAREELLVKEKEHTRARDALAAKRRRMPWMAVEKEYGFEGPDGPMSLHDLFDGRRQLIVYRAFYGPDVTTTAKGTSYPERACLGCSMVADQVSHPGPPERAGYVARVHLARSPGRDSKLEGAPRMGAHPLVHDHRRLRRRLRGWSVARPQRVHQGGDQIFRTYFIDARGDEAMGSTWNYLDVTALGRQEEWEDSPEGYPQTPTGGWLEYNDAYEGWPADRARRSSSRQGSR